QYNCVSLGLVVWAYYFLHASSSSSSSSGAGPRFFGVLPDYLCAVCFVASLCFKQMSLYYAPAFFVYLLARTRQGPGESTVSLSTTSVSFDTCFTASSCVLVAS